MRRRLSFLFVGSASRSSVDIWLICAILRKAVIFKAFWLVTVG